MWFICSFSVIRLIFVPREPSNVRIQCFIDFSHFNGSGMDGKQTHCHQQKMLSALGTMQWANVVRPHSLSLCSFLVNAYEDNIIWNNWKSQIWYIHMHAIHMHEHSINMRRFSVFWADNFYKYIAHRTTHNIFIGSRRFCVSNILISFFFFFVFSSFCPEQNIVGSERRQRMMTTTTAYSRTNAGNRMLIYMC